MYGYHVVGRYVKRLLNCLCLIELLKPGRLEIDGIREYQPGQGSKYTGRQEVLDLLPGLLGDPIINDFPRSLCVGLEIEIHELSEAVIEDNHKEIYEELLDVGVTTLFAAACILDGSLDW